MGDVTLVVVAGTTETAAIDGISAAGADPDLRVHTPSADLEIVASGRPGPGSPVPVSPGGCPTPAVVTRAVRELLGPESLPVAFVDAGLGAPTAAATRGVGAAPGGDVRDPEPVPGAATVFERARSLAPALAASGSGDDAGGDGATELLVAETIPGGTTTALGVLTALGERAAVSSSLPANPIERKRRVVAEGLDASGLDPGGAAGDPIEAVRLAGDPVLAAVAGLLVGCADAGIDATLAGGTQLAAAAALARHAGVDRRLPLATTSLVADDPTADLPALAGDLDLALAAADPGFAEGDHPALAAYARGEAKEGVGMGGALALADRARVTDAAVRDRIAAVTDRLLAERRASDGSGDAEPDGSTPTDGGDRR
ncbi:MULTISPECIES: nicotinate-nucleotide--dimethylbenzimidazole phosphoribosyltransferase [unclassified Halorubrum]|uniref:nicotinate-nucleotide--dimethylbenzimidazole phosphoribosyltransferase n=1 Tax=unclassified Halorubrum TaxID=2642239 RepID=UPI0010FA034F|nr:MULTISPECIES: nicotinate-nucleotide--dimethylbenzimidazole phosphoribosyltransferase [unclassified Halorubrum]TKX44751.1 nicotinate-nucleotide--dimethylbenzimidazole phosphoribosyltransferase [Halorubrum sp. ARQ200]TKX48997.1 nicotinate-nucleotide--dimethylbenzimidazole phosphoribosyltransferase [Halorubrum sp. ASP121]